MKGSLRFVLFSKGNYGEEGKQTKSIYKQKKIV